MILALKNYKVKTKEYKIENKNKNEKRGFEQKQTQKVSA